jgi:hypothetical protein
MVVDLFLSRAALEAEILTLRQQINVLRRTAPKKQTFSSIDRLIFVCLYRLLPGVRDALAIVKPETLAKDLFYTSVTPTSATNQGGMWTGFAEGGTGVRLRLRIEVDQSRQHGELRRIQYLTLGTKTLLNRINDDLIAVGFPEFLPWTTSKIGAFCLPEGDYGDEYEVRLLYKFHQDVMAHPGKDARDLREDNGLFEYWKLPLGQVNDIASVTLLGIEAGPNADMAEIRRIVAGSAFSGMNPTQAP